MKQNAPIRLPLGSADQSSVVFYDPATSTTVQVPREVWDAMEAPTAVILILHPIEPVGRT